MCKKARSIYTFHVADWYVVKRIKHIKMGAEVVIRLKELQVVVLVVKGIWFEARARRVFSRAGVADETGIHLQELKLFVKGIWFEVHARTVVSRLGVPGETVGYSNDTVASKSFRWGRTIGTEHVLLEARHIFETHRVIYAQKTETSLGIDPHVAVIIGTQHTESSLMLVDRNIVLIIPVESHNLEELS